MAELAIYIGTPEDSVEDFLYLDLVVEGKEFPLWHSEDSINDGAPEDFLDDLSKAFNLARLLSKNLGIRTRIDYEQIVQEVEEYDDTIKRNVKHLLKEMKGE